MKYDKKFAAMSTKKLKEILATAEPEDAKTISALIKARQDSSRCYVDKFIVLKCVGETNIFIERDFDDETLAKEFVNVMRKSEKFDFVTYKTSHMLDY